MFTETHELHRSEEKNPRHISSSVCRRAGVHNVNYTMETVYVVVFVIFAAAVGTGNLIFLYIYIFSCKGFAEPKELHLDVVSQYN